MAAVGLRIVGTGTYRPTARVASVEIDARLGQDAGWVETNFRIRERGVSSSSETSSAMGVAAAQAALEAAGCEASSVDVLIGACGVMEQPIPGTSVLIQRKLGLGASGIPAFDVNATCLSFLTALDVAAMGIETERWRRALIVSADIASAALDFSQPGASVIFGDGAAAAVVERTTEQAGSALLAIRMETYGEASELCTLRAGGTRLRPHEDLDGFLAASRFQMDAAGVYRAARKRAPKLISQVLSAAGATLEDMAVIIPHQASAHGIDFLHDVLRLRPDQVVDIFANNGNQIAASLPTALHHAISSGRLKRGDLALLIGTAAGISIGVAVLRY